MDNCSDSPVPLSEEMVGAVFGDARLGKRLGRIVDGMVKSPTSSFAQAAGSEAELEGTYRLLNNPRVTGERIIAPHLEASCRRAQAAGTALVAHDTTSFLFNGLQHRMGLGHIKSGQGFFGHVALAITADGTREPLGVLGLSTIFRSHKTGPAKSWRQRTVEPDKEYLRWSRLIDEVEKRVDGRASLIHVMDREADAYELLAGLVTPGRRFVVRLKYDRNVEGGEGGRHKVSDELAVVEDIVEREVPLSPRPAGGRSTQAKKIYPPRKARVAKLRMRATKITLLRSRDHDRALPPSLTLNVVQVREIDPPSGEAPVEWRLLTTEPIALPSDLEAVVDYYRGRWCIEEYFKALKTGCAFEKRQLESKKSILNALAILVPVAWRLLLLRSLARDAAGKQASFALTRIQLHVLKKASVRVKLPEHPTIQEAMLAVAGLGGHLSRNGNPGWQSLGQGFEKLLILEAGWSLRDEAAACDLS